MNDITDFLKGIFGEESDDKARELANDVWAFAFEKVTGRKWEETNDPTEVKQAVVEELVNNPDLRKDISKYLDINISQVWIDLLLFIASKKGRD